MPRKFSDEFLCLFTIASLKYLGSSFMAVTFQLPLEIEDELRRELGDLDQAAKEAMLVELYRQDKLGHHQLSVALGLDRLETEVVLKKHNVVEDLPTDEEYNAALARLGIPIKP